MIFYDLSFKIEYKYLKKNIDYLTVKHLNN